jgi:hypothetical protein
VNGGKEGKGQGIEDSADANDVWVWMRPHIRFCTIGNCDLLSFLLLIESLPAACKFYPLILFFLKTWSFELRFCHTPVLKSTEPKPPYVCPGCLITRIATI